jgi:hypothetical protein
MMKYNCLLCGVLVQRTHGNHRYCCDEHEKKNKKKRQNYKYALMQPILPVIRKNLEILDAIYKSDEVTKVFTASELQERGLVIAYYGIIPQADGTRMLRFGIYSLIESAELSKTYKIHCDERKTA